MKKDKRMEREQGDVNTTELAKKLAEMNRAINIIDQAIGEVEQGKKY